MALRSLRKTGLGCRIGKRLLKRFTSQKGSKRICSYIFWSEDSINKEERDLCGKGYLDSSRTRVRVSSGALGEGETCLKFRLNRLRGMLRLSQSHLILYGDWLAFLMEDRLEGCHPRLLDPHLAELAPALSFLLTFSGGPSLSLEDCHSGSSEDCNRIVKPLDSTCHRGWVLNHFEWNVFFSASPPLHSSASGGKGLRLIDLWRKWDSVTHSPKPCTSVPPPLGCLHTHAPHEISPGLLVWPTPHLAKSSFLIIFEFALTPPMTLAASMGTGVGCLQDLLILPRFHTQTQLPSLFHAPQNWVQTFTHHSEC